MTPAAALAVIDQYRDDTEVIEVQAQSVTIIEQARCLQVVDDPTNIQALSMLADCRKATKKMDELRRRFVDPLNAHVKDINAFFKANAAPAEEADRILSQKTSDYRRKVQEAARKEQERLRLLAEKRQAAAVAKAEARGVEPPVVIPLVPTVAAPAKTTDTGNGSSVTFRKTPHMEIIDPELVPRQFCSPDEKKCRAALVNGIVAEIPGVRFWYTEEASVR